MIFGFNSPSLQNLAQPSFYLLILVTSLDLETTNTWVAAICVSSGSYFCSVSFFFFVSVWQGVNNHNILVGLFNTEPCIYLTCEVTESCTCKFASATCPGCALASRHFIWTTILEFYIKFIQYYVVISLWIPLGFTQESHD